MDTLRSSTDQRAHYDVEVEEAMDLQEVFRERVDALHSVTDRASLTASGQAEEAEKRSRAKLDDVEAPIVTKGH